MKLPKVELHVHLEGTVSPVLAKKLAKRHGVAWPSTLLNADETGYASQNFMHFLTVFDTLSALIRTPEDYYEVTRDYLKQSHEAGVIYTEMMYSPEHAERMSGGIPSLRHLEAIQAAVDDAERDEGIIGRILITIVRHFGVEAAFRVVQEATHTRLPCVVGLGMGGDELGFPARCFESVFKQARHEGWRYTVHAGEWAGPQEVYDAVTLLQADRIGHGVRAIEDPDVVALLIDQQIPLELCPSSNVAFGVYPSLALHPIQQFLQKGVHISLNSDDPPFILTTIQDEYDRVAATFGLSQDELLTISRMALDAAFIEAPLRAVLNRRLEDHALGHCDRVG